MITGIVGGVAAIAAAIVTFTAMPHAAAIVAAIGIASTATTKIYALFLPKE